MATHCNTLQNTSTQYGYCSRPCNTLQHTAAHCSTLQHIAAHWVRAGERERERERTPTQAMPNCGQVCVHENETSTHLYLRIQPHTPWLTTKKTSWHPTPATSNCWYGLATISRLLQLQVSFAKEPYKRNCILQKRPIILRSLLIVATPYVCMTCLIYISLNTAKHSLTPYPSDAQPSAGTYARRDAFTPLGSSQHCLTAYPKALCHPTPAMPNPPQVCVTWLVYISLDTTPHLCFWVEAEVNFLRR
jgi:hypothetical protein